jgi:hypothetical protein
MTRFPKKIMLKKDDSAPEIWAVPYLGGACADAQVRNTSPKFAAMQNQNVAE